MHSQPNINKYNNLLVYVLFYVAEYTVLCSAAIVKLCSYVKRMT
jgi:hypothetical protein